MFTLLLRVWPESCNSLHLCLRWLLQECKATENEGVLPLFPRRAATGCVHRADVSPRVACRSGTSARGGQGGACSGLRCGTCAQDCCTSHLLFASSERDPSTLSRVSGPPVQLPPVQQPPRTRRGKAPEDGAAAKAGAAVGALHEEEVAVPPRQESPSSAPPDDADTTEPPAAPDAAVVRLFVRATHRSFLTWSASQVALSGPVVPPTEDVSVQPHSAAANTRAADVVAEPASEQPQARYPKCTVVCFRHDLHAYRTCAVSPG